MYSDDEIDSAVSAGALSADSAARLRAHVAQLRRTAAPDEEHVRLLTGFNDIFVVIACVLVLGALWWLGSRVDQAVGAALAAMASWGLAEVFVRRRNMALPAIVLLGAWVLAVFGCVGGLTPAHWGGAAGLATALVAAALAAGVHWWRFRVPVTVAAGCAAGVAAVLASAEAAWPALAGYRFVLLFGAGVAVFALAMRWDASDPERRSRRSDVAFWLHLLAAPMLVHPVFAPLGSAQAAPWLNVLVVLALYLLLAVVSLAIDRRSLMVSALGYVLYVGSRALEGAAEIGIGIPAAAFLIGSALLLLSVFWARARRGVVSTLPPALRARVPGVA